MGGENCQSADFKALLPCSACAEGRNLIELTPRGWGAASSALPTARPNLAEAAARGLAIGSGFITPLQLPDMVEPLQGPLYKLGEIFRRCVLIERDLALLGHYI